MIWLYRSPIPVGRTGGNFLVQIISTCLPSRRGRWGRHPVGRILFLLFNERSLSPWPQGAGAGDRRAGGERGGRGVPGVLPGGVAHRVPARQGPPQALHHRRTRRRVLELIEVWLSLQKCQKILISRREKCERLRARKSNRNPPFTSSNSHTLNGLKLELESLAWDPKNYQNPKWEQTLQSLRLMTLSKPARSNMAGFSRKITQNAVKKDVLIFRGLRNFFKGLSHGWELTEYTPSPCLKELPLMWLNVTLGIVYVYSNTTQ